MDWRIKGAIQGMLARLPLGERVNDLLQVWQGGRRDLAGHVATKVRADWLVMMRMLEESGFSVDGRVVMEIGTGWLPVLPVCFLLAGAREVWTYDLRRHMRADALDAVLGTIVPLLPEIARECRAPEPLIGARLAELSRRAAGGGPSAAGIAYHAPADAAATGLDACSVDLVISNSVLEHVGADVLVPLMAESARLLTADGVALHSVNCGDHYAYFDRGITPLHYLRFSNSQWRRWNNNILYQNRLRPTDFTASARAAGLDVVRRIQTVRDDLLHRDPRLPIAPEFRHYSDDDLCTTSVTFLARPAARST